METDPPFELDALKRDWIEQTPGALFWLRVRRRMDRIRKCRIAAQTRGVLIAERDPLGFAAAFFAAVHLRVPAILGNPKWGRVEWGEVRERVNPALVFGRAPVPVERRKVAAHPLPSTILIPTGGSTGGVKFAVHRWETLTAAWDGLSAFLGPGPIHSCCVLPLYHVSGLMQLVRSFASGGRISFPEFSDLQTGAFPDFPHGTTCLSLVPTQLRRLMAQTRLADPLRACRAVLVGGAAMPLAVAEQAREWRLPLLVGYGMTESAAMATALAPDEFLAGNSSVGRPLHHVRLDILGEGDVPGPVGCAGRIRLRGRSLCKGYHGGAEIHGGEGWITDDEGYFDSVGRLHLLGRRDRLINSGGEKIDPREIEATLLDTGGVEEALVVGIKSEEWGEKLVAFYVSSRVRNDEERWEKEIRADLAGYKVPKIIMQVPSLPLDARGKVDFARVRNLLARRSGGSLPSRTRKSP